MSAGQRPGHGDKRLPCPEGLTPQAQWLQLCAFQEACFLEDRPDPLLTLGPDKVRAGQTPGGRRQASSGSDRDEVGHASGTVPQGRP